MQSLRLATRTVLGFACLALVLGVVLLALAGTLDFVQAWVYLGVFFGSSGLITVYLWRADPDLLQRRVDAGPGAEKSRVQQVIQALAAVAFLSIYAVAALDRRFGWSHVSLGVVVLGDILVALGFFIVFRVFRENTFTAATIEVVAHQTVISTGPYARVRHPMYAGALVMLVGTPLALGSGWALLGVAWIALVIVWRLLDEENFLAANLPGYQDYREQVRYRLVPFIW